MNKFIKSAILCLLPLGAAAQDAGEQPIITIHSSAYTEIGESNKFSLFIGATEQTLISVDQGAGMDEIELDVATIDPETGDFKGTWIPARADAKGVIKIYGDASKIDVISIEGAYITDIEMEQCTNLEILGLQHNALTHLDLTPFTKLAAIYLTDNPFTEATPLVIGAPKPNLQILEVDIIDHLDNSLNISDYPSLAVFDAYHTLGLKSIDPTGCPELRSLSVEMTGVETIDVSKNPKLTSLNVSESRVRTLDLSANTNLMYLMAGHSSGSINTDVKMNDIDLSHNVNLIYVNLNGNNLTDIDLSANTNLLTLAVRRNLLTSIDLSKNTNLYSVDLLNNRMDYATLPLPESTWGEYFYEQEPLEVPISVATGQEIDLSGRVLREGTETTAKVMRKPFTGDALELDASYYEYADGKLTFNKEVSDSVYVVFSNNVFNEYQLETSPFRVKRPSEVGLPSQAMSITADYSAKVLDLCIGVKGASEASPKTVLIDFGDGNKTEYTTTTATLDFTKTVHLTTPQTFSGKVNIWMPEGSTLTAFGIDGTTLYDIDLTKATGLEQLSVTDADLYTIDMRYNRCLTYIDLSDNQLSALSLYGIYGDYEKNVLHTLKAARNGIATFNLRDGASLKVLDLSNNKLTELPMEEFDNIDDINLSNNLLSGELSLTYQLNARSIDISGNPVSSLKLDKFSRLTDFNVSGTNLTLATLPLPAEMPAGYVYAPQNKIALSAQAPAVNLTAQNRVVDGKGTDFKWFKTDGTELTQGVDIDCVDGGTRFLKEDLGRVYCSMTNPAFPGLTLLTSDVTVVGAPTTVVASFTTTSAAAGELIVTGKKESALYVDWRGDGTEFTEYAFTTSGPTSYQVESFAGADVKVYTYGDPADVSVFSLYQLPMSKFNAEPMTGLTALSVSGAGLAADALELPDAELSELNLSGNKLTSFPFAAKYTKLSTLNLSHNGFTAFDASKVPSLSCLYLNNNSLTEVKFNNPGIWDLHLGGNRLESVDLNGLPSLDQLILTSNLLESIDLQPVKSTLRALSIVGNRFTFATLPRTEDAPRLTTLYYGLQARLDVKCTDGKVDLSSQASVGDTPTVYTWFLGEAVLDTESGAYLGEELIEGNEYTVENGVTSFLTTFPEKVMCVMSNEAYPNLLLTTERLTVDSAGIEEVSADACASAPTGCFDLQGRRVDNPQKGGIYIINGRKVYIR